MSRGSVGSRTSLGWQAGCRHWHNGGWGHEGAIKAEIQMGLLTSRALVIPTGKKKIEALGAGVMRDVAESVESDDCMPRDALEVDGHWR